MEIACSKHGASVVMKINGELDALSASTFSEECYKWIQAGETHLILDLEQLSYISSAGLKAILKTGKESKAAGGAMVFCNLQNDIASIFDIAGLAPLFTIHDSLEAALK